MMNFTNDEMNLMCIYQSDSRSGLIAALTEMRGYLDEDEAELREMSDFIKSLGSVRRVEVLPYHTLGLFKWEKLGITYSLDGVQPPSEEAVQRAEELLCIKDYPDFKK